MADDLVDGLDEDDEELPEPGIRVVRTGAPAWIVTFADLTTLMLTFFVLLLSFANMDVVVFRQMMGSMQESFGVTKKEKGAYQLVGKVGEIAEKVGLQKPPTPVDPKVEERNMLADQVGDAAGRAKLMDDVQVFFGDDGLNVRISDSAVFASGSAALKKKVVPFLQSLAVISKSFNYNLIVEGHTDNVPIKTREFPSNWELSTVRATTVLRKLLEFGAPKDRLAAVGYADRKPLRENNSNENRAVNRRVEFKFVEARE